MSDLADEPRADFFVTGNEYVRDGLDLKFIPCDGITLADANQNLQQSFQVAKDFFAQVKAGVIKFVLIGLSPVQAIDENILGDYFKLCLDKGAKVAVVVLPVNAAVKKTYDAAVVKTFRDTINKVREKTTGWRAKFIDLFNIGLAGKLFQDETHLNEEGKAAVTALISSRLYLNGVISPQDLCTAGDELFSLFAKHFPRDPNFPNDDKPLLHRIFCIMAYDDFNRLSETLPRETCLDLMARVFHELTYSYLANLADIMPKDDFNELTTRIFKMTEENIRRKDKIKVGYYSDFSSHWFGDDLFNLLAQDGRFEPIIFSPLDGWYNNEFDVNEFRNDAKRHRAHGLNVFEMKRDSLDIPKPDILFRLRPYPEWIPPAFKLTNIKVKETLLANIPYSFTVVNEGFGSVRFPMFNVLWKKFFPSTVLLERHKKLNKLGMPRGVYSGYPKLDVFFKPDAKFQFDWKMARPDAKKIIWAPHHSIGFGTRTATFQWNYQFMYEFAKAHPEISWVVKPHSLLSHQAIWSGVFPSNEALREYFQKWDDLPNARFYTGTYYQDIFATSDGMIQDCCSFVAEYQYVDKPMIYLTRQGSIKFDELGEAILNASYLVDGRDTDAIAALIQRVFIEGDDYKAAEREEVFDKYLNYPKLNGMLASEFIFKNITDELKLR